MAAAPAEIETNVHYFLSPENGGGPTEYFLGTAGARRRKFDPHPMKITNIRGKEEFFGLDTHGFQIVHSPSRVQNFDDDTIKAQYYKEVEELMKKMTGASYAHVFSHVVRRDSHQKALEIPKEIKDEDPINIATPAMFAHIDQSYIGAQIVLNSLADRDPEASDVLHRTKGKRWAIINAWRPLKPITREPLAVCDARTVSESDLREITLKIPKQLPPVLNNTSSWADQKQRSSALEDSPYGPDKDDPTREEPSQKIWQITYNPKNKWYWPSGMRPEEVLLIKCFDSRRDVARRAPHSAIQTPEDRGPARESIEVRCIVVWEDQPTDNERALL